MAFILKLAISTIVSSVEERFFVFSKLTKFVDSDEGLPCVNTIEKIYLSLLIIVFALAILSLFRLSHFRTELRKVFDPRPGFTIIPIKIFNKIISNFENS